MKIEHSRCSKVSVGFSWGKIGCVVAALGFLLGCLPAISFAQSPPIVGHWAFDNNLQDSSSSLTHGSPKQGKNQPGTAEFTPNGLGGTAALFLDNQRFVGMSDTQQISPLNFDVDDPFSVSVWVRKGFRNAGNGQKRILLGKMSTKNGDLSGWAIFFEYFRGVDQIVFNHRHRPGDRIKVRTDIKTDPVRQDNSLSEGMHHIAVVYNGNGHHSGMSIYVNGQAIKTVNQGNFSTEDTLTNAPFNVGARDNNVENNGKRAFIGHIEHLLVFSDALKPGEITCLYSQPLTCPTGGGQQMLVWDQGQWERDNWQNDPPAPAFQWDTGKWERDSWPTE